MDVPLINKCFEEDWKTKKPIKFKKSEEDEVKKEMRRVYELIKWTYRALAGIDPTGNIMSIGMNTINTFMNEVLDCID